MINGKDNEVQINKTNDNVDIGHKGHRERLKKRYLDGGFSSFSEHEVLELILFYAIPRRDTKQLAKKLLKQFGNIQNVFDATPLELNRLGGLSENSAILVSLILKSYEVYIGENNNKLVLDNTSAVYRYLRQFFINEKRECFYIICLNVKKQLIKTCLVSEGSVSETHIYIRNIIEDVIKSNAVNVILAHNHPSQICEPSDVDIITTNKIINSLNMISVNVIDHIIMTDNDYYSFVKNKLIKKQSK